MNVSNETITAIKELNGEFFAMNRWWDATVGVLGVTFVCEQSSRLIHEHIAHWYASEADVLNESRTIDFQNKFMAVRKIADSNDDILIVVELDKILRAVNEQVAQMILIRDKAELYKDDIKAFDHDFPTFFTLDSKDGTRGV